MPHYCAFNATSFNATANISVPAWSGPSGAATWSVEVDFVVTSLANQVTLIGDVNGIGGAFDVFPSGAIGLRAQVASAAGLVVVGTRYKAKVTREGSNTLRVYIKPASNPSYGASVASITNASTYIYNSLGKNQAGTVRAVNYYGLEITGGTYSDTWNDTNSPSTGITWTGVNGGVLTLNGTQGTPDAWWVFYSSGDTISSTAAWSITPIQWQGSAAVAAPTFSSTAAWSVSPMQWQGAANATPPVFNSVTAWSISPLQWQAAAASTAPGAIANAVAWTLTPLQWQATAQPAPVVQSSAAWSISQLNWQSTANATVPTFTASAAWSITPMQWQASAAATAPGATASTVNWSISPMHWQGSAAATVPTFNAAAAWTISPMVWQVSASIAGAPVFAAKGATITERFGSHAIIERLQTARIYE
jgi:hypothetical protein